MQNSYPSQQLQESIQREITAVERAMDDVDIDNELRLRDVDEPPPEWTILGTQRSHELRAAKCLFAKLREEPPSVASLNLLLAALAVMPTNYTAWVVRRAFLRELWKSCPAAADVTAMVRTELIGSAVLALKVTKNFQVWCHRRNLLEAYIKHMQQLGAVPVPPLDDRVVIDIALAEDAKNYHAWSYRKWFVRAFDQFGSELKVTQRLLLEDPLNNSAWVHRYFVHEEQGTLSSEKEMNFAQKLLAVRPDNQAVLNYIQGLKDHSQS